MPTTTCLDIVDLLVAAGVDIAQVSPGAWTPLQLAASYVNVGAARALLVHGADPLAQTAKISAWSLALGSHSPALVRLFLKHGCDPNAPLDNGQVPVCLAASDGATGIVDVLIEAGARLASDTFDAVLDAAPYEMTIGEQMTTLRHLVADPTGVRLGVVPLPGVIENDERLKSALQPQRDAWMRANVANWTPDMNGT